MNLRVTIILLSFLLFGESQIINSDSIVQLPIIFSALGDFNFKDLINMFQKGNQCLNHLLIPNKKVKLNFLAYSGKKLNDIGNYDNCVNSNMTMFYFNLILSKGTSPSIVQGLCMPSICTAEDFEPLRNYIFEILLNYTKKHPLGPSFNLTKENVFFINVKETNDSFKEISVPQIIFLVILGGLTLFSITIGIIQLYESPEQREKNMKSRVPFYYYFGFHNNATSLMTIENGIDPNLDVFNGIRVLSLCWVILGHTFLFIALQPVTDLPNFFDELQNKFSLELIAGGVNAVDVFFFLSGFLASSQFIYEFNKNKNNKLVSYLKMIIKRYLRLLPLYLVAIFFVFSFYNLFLSSAPILYFRKYTLEYCKSNWWYNFLYINNFISLFQECLGWTWYLANDFQFYLITPIFIIIFLKSKLAGYLSILFFAFCSIIVQALIIYKYDLSYALTHQGKADPNEVFYVRPYTRVLTYIMGIMCSWLYLSHKNSKLRSPLAEKINYIVISSQSYRIFCYLIGIGLTFFSVFFGYHYNHNPDGTTYVSNMLFLIFQKPLFVLGIILITYPNLLGIENPFSRFLKIKFFNVLARLTYGAYLFQLIIITILYTYQFQYSHIKDILSYIDSIMFMALAYAVSYVLTIIFEYPVRNFVNILFYSKRSKKGSKGEITEGKEIEQIVTQSQEKLADLKINESLLKTNEKND